MSTFEIEQFGVLSAGTDTETELVFVPQSLGANSLPLTSGGRMNFQGQTERATNPAASSCAVADMWAWVDN